MRKRGRYFFAGINRVMRTDGRLPAGGGPIPRGVRRRAPDPEGGGGGGGGTATLDPIEVGDSAKTASEKSTKLTLAVRDLVKNKEATGEELAKIKAAVDKLLDSVEEERKELLAQKALVQQMASSAPGGKSTADDASWKIVLMGARRNETIEKDVKASSPISPGYIHLIRMTDAQLLEMGASEDQRVFARRLRKLNDTLYIRAQILARSAPEVFFEQKGMRGFPEWAEYEALAKRVQLALGEGTPTAGGSWVPTLLSGNLIELVQLPLDMTELFDTRPMGSLVHEWTVEGADNTAFFIDEAEEINESDITTAKQTWTARKMASYTSESYELDQDSVITMVAHITSKLARGLRRGEHEMVGNGQRSGGIDSTYSAGANNVREMADGIRKAFALTLLTPIDAGLGITADMLAEARGPMGAYGVDPTSLFYWCESWGYARLLTLRAEGGATVVLTPGEFGDAATAKTGRLGSIFNSPIRVNEFMPATLNAAGVIDGASFRTAIALVNHRAGSKGERQGIFIDSSTHVRFRNHQIVFKAVRRMDFEWHRTPSPTEVPVNLIGNVKTTAAS